MCVGPNEPVSAHDGQAASRFLATTPQITKQSEIAAMLATQN